MESSTPTAKPIKAKVGWLRLMESLRLSGLLPHHPGEGWTVRGKNERANKIKMRVDVPAGCTSIFRRIRIAD